MALMAAVSMAQLTACGSAEPKNTELAYENMDGLTSSFRSSIIFENSDKEILTEAKEASGAEEIVERTLLKNTEFLSKPNIDASVLGVVEANAVIRVIELQEDGWAKAVYRGRVAYVPRSAFKEELQENHQVVATQHGNTEGNQPVRSGDNKPAVKPDDKPSGSKPTTGNSEKTEEKEDKKEDNKEEQNTETGSEEGTEQNGNESEESENAGEQTDSDGNKEREELDDSGEAVGDSE